MPYYRSVGRGAPQAAHPVPPARRRPLRRGADGPGGLLLRLVAALPPVPADRDRRRRGVRPAGLVPDRRTGRSSRATCAPTSSTAPAPTRCSAASTCWPTTTAASRTWSPTGRRRSTATRSATSASTSRPARPRVESTFGALDVGRRRLRDHPDLGRSTGSCRPATPAADARHRGDRAHRPAEALPVGARPVPGARARTASATCAARPSRCWSTATDVEVLRAAPARLDPVTSTPTTRSTWSAGTAASTRGRSRSTTSSRSPAGCTSRRRCTRRSRARTS